MRDTEDIEEDKQEEEKEEEEEETEEDNEGSQRGMGTRSRRHVGRQFGSRLFSDTVAAGRCGRAPGGASPWTDVCSSCVFFLSSLFFCVFSL